jgi:hypothetical protein
MTTGGWADSTATPLREARDQYFTQAGLGPDGGYRARWVRFRLGPLIVPVPNTRARRLALPLHDLHHLATAYDTSWTGESEIAAWELASGCAGYAAAWVLNLIAFQIGLVIAPARVWQAFRHGRQSRNLYREPWNEAWLDSTVGALRKRLGVLRTLRPATPVDTLWFLVCGLPTVAGVVFLVLAVG